MPVWFLISTDQDGQRALQIILEEGETFDDGEVSECADHIDENSESDTDFEEEDEIEHQLVSK